MKFESVSEAVAAFVKIQNTMSAYRHAMGVLELDATTAAPSDSWEGRSKTMEVLSEIIYHLTTDPENKELYDYLHANNAELDAVTIRQLEVLSKEYDNNCKIPKDEYIAYQVLLNDAQANWVKAKTQDDFPSFLPYLEKIVEYNRKFAGYYNPSIDPYDALLNLYEEGITMKKLDAFFAEIRVSIVPLLEKVANAPQIECDFLNAEFPIDKQRELSKYLMDIMGLDRSHCAIAETEHPFTTNFNNRDVRITTHYMSESFVFSMYSVIHEGGHALYELGADDCYNYTAIQGGVSMGIHESQSRFYENMIGKSRAFIHAVYPKICDLFPEQMKGATEEMLYKAINNVKPSLIRTEADELTYCLHIMVRYEIEKELISGTLKVKDVPERWNQLYKEYLGIDVPNDREGCLQDSHWSGGMIGYFPSYALGSAYGAQFLSKMQEELGDIYTNVSIGDLSEITNWLKTHIHRYASFKKPNEIIADVLGEFDPTYYSNYLNNKFSELYQI